MVPEISSNFRNSLCRESGKGFGKRDFFTKWSCKGGTAKPKAGASKQFMKLEKVNEVA